MIIIQSREDKDKFYEWNFYQGYMAGNIAKIIKRPVETFFTRLPKLNTRKLYTQY